MLCYLCRKGGMGINCMHACIGVLVPAKFLRNAAFTGSIRVWHPAYEGLRPVVSTYLLRIDPFSVLAEHLPSALYTTIAYAVSSSSWMPQDGLGIHSLRLGSWLLHSTALRWVWTPGFQDASFQDCPCIDDGVLPWLHPGHPSWPFLGGS